MTMSAIHKTVHYLPRFDHVLLADIHPLADFLPKSLFLRDGLRDTGSFDQCFFILSDQFFHIILLLQSSPSCRWGHTLHPNNCRPASTCGYDTSFHRLDNRGWEQFSDSWWSQ